MKRQLGPYHLVESLGAGGMAEVFLAHARREGDFVQPCVVKILHSELVNDENFTGMLVEEAKLVARLRHNNIASLYDVGRHGGEMFLVMEHVDGQDLHNILARAARHERKIPMAFAVHVARQMCAGLHFAHTRRGPQGEALNLVHRDISPPNVLVSAVGEVKVIDFGVAKFNSTAREKTRAGIIKGKFGYMSPEQAWDEELDHRSDIFSVGICLYEMLTGRSLYGQVEDALTMIRRAREADIAPVTQWRPDIPAELARAVHCSLSANREDRFQSAHEMERQMAVVLAEYAPDYTTLDAGVFVNELFDTGDPALTSVSPRIEPIASPSNGAKPLDETNRSLNETTRPIADVPAELRDDNDVEHLDLSDVLNDQLEASPDDDATVDFSFSDFVVEKTELFEGRELPGAPPVKPTDPPRKDEPTSKADRQTRPLLNNQDEKTHKRHRDEIKKPSIDDEKTQKQHRDRVQGSAADNGPESQIQSNPLVSRSGRHPVQKPSPAESPISGTYSRPKRATPPPDVAVDPAPEPRKDIGSTGAVSVPDPVLEPRRDKNILDTGAQALPTSTASQKLAQKAPSAGSKWPPEQGEKETDEERIKRYIQTACAAAFVLLAIGYLLVRLNC